MIILKQNRDQLALLTFSLSEKLENINGYVILNKENNHGGKLG